MTGFEGMLPATDESGKLVAPDVVPVFTLKATDVLAPLIIREWIRAAVDAEVDSRKIEGALVIHRDLLRWQREHPDRVKIPD